MRIYVASSWRNTHYPEIIKKLRAMKHEVYDFRNPAPGNYGFSWSEIDENRRDWTPVQYSCYLEHPISVKGFSMDFSAMQWADLCILVLPSGRSAHTEAGWMKGVGKKVFVYMPEVMEPELMYKIYDGIITDLSKLEEIGLLNFC